MKFSHLPIVLLLTMALSPLAPVPASAETARGDHRPHTGREWLCNAYGYSSTGSRSTWQTVTGAHKATEASAKESALAECRKKLNGCRPSGCWPH